MSITEDELKERVVAPRVTLEEVHSNIVSEFFFTAADGVRGESVMGISALVGPAQSLNNMTFCVLVLKNGFTVTGQSACADPANYKRDIGERIAKQDAINKIWPLMGYELRTKLALIESNTWLDRAKVELVELEDRVIKLVGFLASPGITKIDPREWSALRAQRKGMEEYLCQLRGRVARASI